jgi:hypothetical protein
MPPSIFVHHHTFRKEYLIKAPLNEGFLANGIDKFAYNTVYLS